MNWFNVRRFTSKYMIDQNTECYVWTATKIHNGYGHFRIKDKLKLAHRVAYESVHGEIAEGFQVDHLCKNRACVNPKHLEIVSSKENTLRGDSISANNARKTHCLNGHKFDADNTYKAKRQRECLLCKRRRNREYYQRKNDNKKEC